MRLAEFAAGQPDDDADDAVSVEPRGAIPLLYDLMYWELELAGYEVEVFGYDWRKNLDESAGQLAALIQSRGPNHERPLHIIAHSQGSLVARRAVQILGASQARSLINTLILLGPASKGTFAAAFAIAGSHTFLDTLPEYGLKLPDDMPEVLQSMSGLYQLLPWDPAAVPWLNDHSFTEHTFWETGVDQARLKEHYNWAGKIDTTFFNDRTSIILGDQPETAFEVEFQDGKLVATGTTAWGDGTVPESCARLKGVATYKAPDAEHMRLPAKRRVLSAVRKLLKGETPGLEPPSEDQPPAFSIRDGLPLLDETQIPRLADPEADETPRPRRLVKEAKPLAPVKPYVAPPIPPPPFRRLRVYSFDPLLGTNLDALGIDQLTVSVPWDEFSSETGPERERLQAGPVGEYLEVIDHDPASGCFYPPIDLNDPHLLAQDGLAPSEGNPQFHQQMVYAVSMATVGVFRKGAGPGRSLGHALAAAEKRPGPARHPRREAFRASPAHLSARPARGQRLLQPEQQGPPVRLLPRAGSSVGGNLPGGTVFTCLSYDIIAHETTHALLDGLHRYFIEPSNGDVLAFHEAFADIVALFQHFTMPRCCATRSRKTRGDLARQNLLGQLAQQFGEATGHRGALRSTLAK